MSVEKIIADFETCKKAVGIGLKLNTVFDWDYDPTWFNGIIHYNGVNLGIDRSHLYTIPAPTAEEVPLPFRSAFKHGKGYYAVQISYWQVAFDTMKGFGKERHEIKIDPNEATARLKMAIWLIEKVPEARQWYVENGYLDEVNNDRD